MEMFIAIFAGLFVGIPLMVWTNMYSFNVEQEIAHQRVIRKQRREAEEKIEASKLAQYKEYLQGKAENSYEDELY